MQVRRYHWSRRLKTVRLDSHKLSKIFKTKLKYPELKGWLQDLGAGKAAKVSNISVWDTEIRETDTVR